MPRPSALRKILGRPQPPLTIEQLADWWATKNVSALAEIAMRSMLDPPGTAYEVPPLCLVVFESGDARILYQLRLHNAGRAQGLKHPVQYAIGRHIDELVAFARQQFLAQLTHETRQGIFQEDEFCRVSR